MLKYLILLLAISGVLSTPVLADEEIEATSYTVQDLDTGEIIKSHNDQEIRSIASVTKLMSAVVTIESGIDLDRVIEVKRIKGIKSKLPNRAKLSLHELMHLSLMSSDNLATKLLAENYPGGEAAHIAAMNSKARDLAMHNTSFADPTGLDENNVSTAQDLTKLLAYSEHFELIKHYSTSADYSVKVKGKKKTRFIDFHTTNRLVKINPDIIISKTGWIRKSGECLVMLVKNQNRNLAIVLLNSKNTRTRIKDGALLYGT